MGNNSHSPKKTKPRLEPISIAELAGDSTMRGFSDLFRIPTEPVAKNISSLATDPLGLKTSGSDNQALLIGRVEGSQQSKAPNGIRDKEILSIAKRESIDHIDPLGVDPVCAVSQIPDNYTHWSSDPEGPRVDSEKSTQVQSYRDLKRSLSQKRVRKIKQVQDALTPAGQLLYLAMYGSYREESPVKICRKGYRELADRAHIDKDTVRVLIEDFKMKGVVREIGTHDSKANLGKTYEVRSFSRIKQLWLEAGIEYATMERRPALCDAEGRKFLTPSGSKDHWVLQPEDLTQSGAVGSKPTGPVGARPTPIDKRRETNSTSSKLLRELLQSFLPGFDDQACSQLWDHCQANVPDVRPEEVGLLFEQKLWESRTRNVWNQNGFLLRAVHQSCTIAAIKGIRTAKQSSRETKASFIPETPVSEIEALLNDPNTPVELRRYFEQRVKAKSFGQSFSEDSAEQQEFS